MKRVIYTFIMCFWVFSCYAWNATGHRVVAQIAYDHLSPKAKAMCATFLQVRPPNTLNNSFVRASTWMDELRYRGIYWYDGMHYIDIPFTQDDTRLPPIEKTNAVWAIQQAVAVLSSKKTNNAEKGFALRLLIHVVGDIHQPLHATTRVSSELPKGDLGGNLFPLGSNPVGTNLHKYWDNGAGVFLGRYSAKKIKTTAHLLEKLSPCVRVTPSIKPRKWAKMSHQLAVKNVYHLNPKDPPSKRYQANAQDLVQKQVVFAGCRLAMILNKLAEVA